MLKLAEWPLRTIPTVELSWTDAYAYGGLSLEPRSWVYTSPCMTAVGSEPAP